MAQNFLSDIQLGDNIYIRLGDGSDGDLRLYRNATHSYLDSANTGDLYIRSLNDDVVIQGADDVFIYTQGGEDAIIARGDGAVELYYNNSKTFETASTGVVITGNADPATDSLYDLGTDTVRWANVYADTLHGDGSNITGVAADKASSVILTVKNKSGGSLSKGTIVHAHPSVSPPSGNVIEVIAADNDDTTKMPAIGILNETLADEAEGEAVMFGRISGISTTDDGTSTGTLFSIGDELYVSSTPGLFTNVKPTGTKLIQKIAVVIKSHATNGTIEVFGAGRTNDVPTPLYIDHVNQRVGIGEITPDNILHISKSQNASTTLQIENANTGTGARANLHLQSDASRIDLYATSSTYNGVASWIDAGVINTSTTSSGGLILNSQAGGIKFQTGTNEYMRITSGGLVGINGTPNTAQLHIHGTATNNEILRLEGSYDTSNPFLSFYQNGTRRSFIQHNDSNDNLIIASEYGLISFKTATDGSEAERMRIASDGSIQHPNTGNESSLLTYSANQDKAITKFYQAQNYPTTNAYTRSFDIVASGDATGGGQIRFLTSAGNTAPAQALLLDSSQNATFAGQVKTTAASGFVIDAAADMSMSYYTNVPSTSWGIFSTNNHGDTIISTNLILDSNHDVVTNQSHNSIKGSGIVFTGNGNHAGAGAIAMYALGNGSATVGTVTAEESYALLINNTGATFAGDIKLADNKKIKGTTYSAAFISFESDGETRISANDDVVIGYGETLNISNAGVSTFAGDIITKGKIRDYDTKTPNQNLLDIGSIKISNRDDLYGNVTKTVINDYKATYANDNTGSTTVRVYVDSGILVDGDTYMVSVYYEGLVGSLSLDWCDTAVTGNGTQTGTSASPTSGRIWGYASRSTYDSTYRFFDINLTQGSGHTVTLFNPKVEAGTILTDFVATERTNIEANSKDFNNVTATGELKVYDDATFAGLVGIGAANPGDRQLYVEGTTSIIEIESTTANANASVWFRSNVSNTSADRWELGTNISQSSYFELYNRATSATAFHINSSNNNATFEGNGEFKNSLKINAPDGGSAPAMTATLNMHGYEGRGVGIKIRDSVNSASGASNREWFVGSGYNTSGFNIGYASDGSQSSYAAQAKLSITTSGNATFAGSVQSTNFFTSTNLNNTGDTGLGIPTGQRLGFDQSGTRSWTIKAEGGNLNVYSGDGNGGFNVAGLSNGIITDKVITGGSHLVLDTSLTSRDLLVKTGNTTHLTIDGGDSSATFEGALTVKGDEFILGDGNYEKVLFDTSPSSVLGNGTMEIQPQTIPGSGTAQFTTYFKNNAATGTTQHNIKVDGNVTVGGNLTVSGTTTTIDTTNLDVKDKNITLNYGSGDTSSNADGAGITIQDAVDASNNATILWDQTNSEFDFSHGANFPIVKAGQNNNGFLFGSKSVSLTENTFVDVLTVNMDNHEGCYVKITAFGDWNSHSSVQYLGEFFLTNGAGGYGEPGMIIRQVDNTQTDSIVAQIVDPAGTSGARDFVIQLKADDTIGSNSVSIAMQYEVRGQFNSVT